MVAMRHPLLGSCYLIDFALTQVKANDTMPIIGLLHLIPTPPPPLLPVEDLPFLLSPEEWLKLHSPLKNLLKIWALPLKNLGLSLKNFVNAKEFYIYIYNIYIYIYIFFFYSTSKRILNFYNLPPGEFYGSSTGVVRILNAIAQDNFYFAY